MDPQPFLTHGPPLGAALQYFENEDARQSAKPLNAQPYLLPLCDVVVDDDFSGVGKKKFLFSVRPTRSQVGGGMVVGGWLRVVSRLCVCVCDGPPRPSKYPLRYFSSRCKCKAKTLALTLVMGLTLALTSDPDIGP